MLDFNHSSLSWQLNALLEVGHQKEREKEPPRHYLGPSRLGAPCSRMLQYEYFNTPKDPGKDFSGQSLRIFEFGHKIEELMIGWLRLAGFDLRTQRPDGRQFEFICSAESRIRGHIDGVLVSGPASPIRFPALWECKSMNSKHWKACVKDGVKISKPLYAVQIAIYQREMNLSDNPALFTAVNKDTSEVHSELVPYDADLAERMINRGIAVLQACDAGKLLPRIAQSPDFYECKWCAYTERCFRE